MLLWHRHLGCFRVPSWKNPAMATSRIKCHSSWWFQHSGFNPSEKYQSNWIISAGRGETKIFEPPHSILWHFTYNLFFESSHNSFISSFTKFASQRCLRTRWAAISRGPGEITQVKPITGRVLPPCKGKTKRLDLCDM